MFSANDLVVYPAQGVERIDSREVGGTHCDFYIVRIRANNITLMVPVSNADHVGLRTLISPDAAEAILAALRENTAETVYSGQNWNRRFREYSERLKDQDLAVVARVLRELLLIGMGKELSFGERRLLEQAMSLVTGEIGEVLRQDPEDIRRGLLEHYAPAGCGQQ